MDLDGKICLITGANSGLGFGVTKKMAIQKAHIILSSRTTEEGEQAIDEIKQETPHASVELLACDLASMKSIQRFIDDLKQRHSKLDILFNNAALMKQKRTITEDGYEMMFQVNYLAPFVLMLSLLDLLKHGSSPCIIGNGRPSDKLRLDMDNLQFTKNYNMYKSFFHTKLCLLFACMELSRMPERENIEVAMIDPGPFKSGLVRDVPLAGWIKNLFSAPVDKAAENILFHLTADRTNELNGKVFKEKHEYPITSYWRDSEISKQLWSETEALLKGKINL